MREILLFSVRVKGLHVVTLDILVSLYICTCGGHSFWKFRLAACQ